VYEREFAPLGAVQQPVVKRDIPLEAVDKTLPRRVQDYLNMPVARGNRNGALFVAACFYRDSGRSQGEAENALGAKAQSDGLSQSEAQHTIQSAYRRPANYQLPAHMHILAAVEDTRK